MAVKTYAQQLEEVQAAIAKIEGGEQRWQQGDRSAQLAELETLYKRETWLRRMVNRSDRGGIRVRRARPS